MKLAGGLRFSLGGSSHGGSSIQIPCTGRLCCRERHSRRDVYVGDGESEIRLSGVPFVRRCFSRVHSRYKRTALDLPSSGRSVRIIIVARRFRCDVGACPKRIFTERFGDEVLAPSARRTSRLEIIVHHLGLALGGRPAEGFAKRLMLPVSKDTLLRVVRRRSAEPAETLLVVGIDDWAYRRNHRYGTIVLRALVRGAVLMASGRRNVTSFDEPAARRTKELSLG